MQTQQSTLCSLTVRSYYSLDYFLQLCVICWLTDLSFSFSHLTLWPDSLKTIATKITLTKFTQQCRCSKTKKKIKPTKNKRKKKQDRTALFSKLSSCSPDMEQQRIAVALWVIQKSSAKNNASSLPYSERELSAGINVHHPKSSSSPGVSLLGWPRRCAYGVKGEGKAQKIVMHPV